MTPSGPVPLTLERDTCINETWNESIATRILLQKILSDEKSYNLWLTKIK